MKNTLISSALLSALFLSASNAWAAPSVELKVTGSFTTPSCSMINVNNGVFEFGKISVTNVHQTNITPLKPQAQTVNISCDSETYLSFKSIDNRAGTASAVNDKNFGLGAVNGSGKLGYYTLEMLLSKVDGIAGGVFTTTGSNFSNVERTFIQPGARSGWSKSDNVQFSGKVFSALFLVTPYLASEKTMNGPITDQAKLDGSATLALSFGL